MKYSLKFFKTFESTKTVLIDDNIINKLIAISKRVSNLPIKLVENKPTVYIFNTPLSKYKDASKFETRVLSQEEKTIIEIKSNLNKLTNDNLIDITKNLLQLIKKETFDIVFEISYKNNFYSKTFTDMVVLICNKNEEFKNYIHKKYEFIYELFENVKYVPETNYDEYCDNVKIIEERKSFCCFFSYLCVNGFIELEKMRLFLDYLLEKINIFIQEENRKNEVDELLDVTYNICNILKIIPDNELIKTWSTSTNKTFKSLSNKSIYKCMDILEII
jgi:hypothetical protein